MPADRLSPVPPRRCSRAARAPRPAFLALSGRVALHPLHAVAILAHVVAIDPRFPRVHYYLGLTYLYKDGAAKIADAIEEFKIELAANPEEYFANFYLGILYIMERKFPR